MNATTNINPNHISNEDNNSKSNIKLESINSNPNFNVKIVGETSETKKLNLNEISLHEICPHIDNRKKIQNGFKTEEHNDSKTAN